MFRCNTNNSRTVSAQSDTVNRSERQIERSHGHQTRSGERTHRLELHLGDELTGRMHPDHPVHVARLRHVEVRERDHDGHVEPVNCRNKNTVLETRGPTLICVASGNSLD